MYKLYSVHVNDLLICPSPHPPHALSGGRLTWCSLMILPTSPLVGPLGRRWYFPFPRAQKCSGSPCACVPPSLISYPFSEHVVPPPPLQAVDSCLPRRVWSSIKITTACALKTQVFCTHGTENCMWGGIIKFQWSMSVTQQSQTPY